MKVGDVVIPNKSAKERYFHSGSEVYNHAIVASLDPFILISSQGDMRWSCTWEAHEVEVLCQASQEIQEIVQSRLESGV